VAEVCQSFVVDNGAFTAWKAGREVDWREYLEWVEVWSRHPGFDWALIPDVIDGDETSNDDLLDWWDGNASISGVPVWHLHESLERLHSMAKRYGRIAIGSSGDFSAIGTFRWWNRMFEVMRAVTSCGRPITKLHGLRMLDPDVFTRLPFSSADSTNVARNIGLDGRWGGTYQPIGKAARGVVLADRIESQQSASVWREQSIQDRLIFTLPDGKEYPTGGEQEDV
jgi:hypothetical protein